MLFFSRGAGKKEHDEAQKVPNLATVIPAMDHIDTVLATNAIDNCYCLTVQAALTIGKKTLNHYYSKTDLSNVYRIAMGKILSFICITVHKTEMAISPTPLSQARVFPKGRLARRLDRRCKEDHS
jgi:uncharacterized protein YjaG (DUF416 family)